MASESQKAHYHLLKKVDQFDVDFVIPKLGIDVPVGIDPFLLFKSRDSGLVEMHDLLLKFFNQGVLEVHEDNPDRARRIFDFPEPKEIGLGYAKSSKKGSGVGDYLATLIIETLQGAPMLRERGIKHIEEMQLVSVGIGPDRISDVTANILKSNLISYTQTQCELWGIETTKGVPVQHILDHQTQEWFDGFFDLPINPIDRSPIILVPRRIVRTLPWINYDDYVRTEFAAYMRAKRTKANTTISKSSNFEKKEIVTVSRQEIERVDKYIAKKEATAIEAQPSLEYLAGTNICNQAEVLKNRLNQIPTGKETAAQYQKLCIEILNFLFTPELIDGRLEVRTKDGTERRDIIFTNDSDDTFWSYLRNEHSSILLMFEAKNKASINNNDIAQTATYLGDRLGRLGFILMRSQVTEPQQLKVFSVYNDSNPRKIILFVTDNDFNLMLDMKCEGKNPMRYLQKLYRNFRTTVQ